MTEKPPEYVTDALEMIGSGYDQPTVVIEPPRSYTARRNGEMIEVDEPAWVKFSTDFKKELKTLDEYSLKVFVYIGLSVNFETGEAFPGIRKIAEDTGMGKNTVAKAVENLENLKFLTIFRREGASNIYKPVRFISIGTVPPEGTPLAELSLEDDLLSLETDQLSLGQEGNLHNKNNKNNKTGDLVDAILKYNLSPKAIRDAIATHFRLTPNFETKYNRQWMQWAMENDVTPEKLKVAAELWRVDKRFNWAMPTLKGIQEHWLELIGNQASAEPIPEYYKPYIPEPETANKMTAAEYKIWKESHEQK
jgi:hypothetical protein